MFLFIYTSEHAKSVKSKSLINNHFKIHTSDSIHHNPHQNIAVTEDKILNVKSMNVKLRVRLKSKSRTYWSTTSLMHIHYHNNTLTNNFISPTHPMQLPSSFCSGLGLIPVTLARFEVWYI